MNGDLTRLAVFAAIKAVQYQDLVFARLTVVHENKAVSHQKSAVPIHLAHIDRITRPVTSRVRGVDMAEPVQLSVRMPQ